MKLLCMNLQRDAEWEDKKSYLGKKKMLQLPNASYSFEYTSAFP